MMTDIRELILETVDRLAECFLKEDRKEDAELPLGAIEEAVRTGGIYFGEISTRFELRLRKLIPVPVDEPGVHGGQAGHIARSERIQAEVAQMEE